MLANFSKSRVCCSEEPAIFWRRRISSAQDETLRWQRALVQSDTRIAIY